MSLVLYKIQILHGCHILGKGWSPPVKPLNAWRDNVNLIVRIRAVLSYWDKKYSIQYQWMRMKLKMVFYHVLMLPYFIVTNPTSKYTYSTKLSLNLTFHIDEPPYPLSIKKYQVWMQTSNQKYGLIGDGLN